MDDAPLPAPPRRKAGRRKAERDDVGVDDARGVEGGRNATAAVAMEDVAAAGGHGTKKGRASDEDDRQREDGEDFPPSRTQAS